MFDALAEIRTACFTNISPKHYSMRQLPREVFIAKRNYYIETKIEEKIYVDMASYLTTH